MSAYLEWFKAHRKGYASARTVIETHVLRSFGRDTVVAPVYCPSGTPYPFSAAGIRRWHQDLAAAPARFRPGKERQKTRPAPAAADEVRARKATANRVLTYLRAALNFNVAEGKIPKAAESIWTSVRPFRKVDKPRIRFFDAEETSRLLNVCDPDFKHLVTGALLTGGRYGGLTAMLVRDFNEESGFVQLTEKAEGDEPRTVFLNEEGIRFFSSLSAGREPNEIMFLRSDGGPWKRSHQTRPMAEAAKAAHLAPPNNFHILRHTYASLYLMGGGSLEGLARQLGHADTRMTIRSYAHLAERWRAKEARASAPRFGIEAPTNVLPFKAV